MLHKNFSNTSRLMKLIFRRERVISAIWIVALVLFSIAIAPAIGAMFPDDAGRTQFAESFNNPIMIAMMGPIYGSDNYTVGAMYGGVLLLYFVIAVAVMNIFFVVRHTRADEERGRAEVVRALPTGRLANINATMLSALALNAVLALLIGFGIAALRIESMSIEGCMVYGAASGAAGLVFAAIAALFSQLSSNSSSANGMSFAALGLFYMIRAAGDMQGSDLISCASPLGLVLRSQTFVENRLIPSVALLLEAVVISAVAYKLNAMRDLGQGFISAKPGRVVARRTLLSPVGLAWRLLRTMIITWFVVMFVLGASYGTVIADIEAFVGDSPEYLQVLGIPSEIAETMTDAYKSKIIVDYFGMFVTSIMSIVCMVPVLNAAMKARGEEREGRAEHIVSKSVSRSKYLSGYVLFAYIGSVMIQAATAAGLYVSTASATGEANPFTLGGLMESFFVYLPAVWVMIGVGVLVIGLIPKATGVVWGLFGFVAFMSFLGQMPGLLPEWLSKVSPMTHIPRLPLDDVAAAPLIILSAVAVVLTASGFAFYSKRDTVQ